MLKMHIIQEKLLILAERKNLALISLREMSKLIGLPDESPQRIKHHLLQLEKKGFISIDRANGVMHKKKRGPGWATGFLKKNKKLFSIPIIGTANCGPATIFSEQNFQGFLRISTRLVHRSKPDGIYAIKADGLSMNRANIDGKTIDDGDLVLVDSKMTNAQSGDIVLAILDDKATIKRLIDDKKNSQIVLKAESTYDYEPIYLHPKDDFYINGKVIAVVKKPM